MLNYIWLSLILIGIGVAVYSDIHDISSDRYHNGENLEVILTPANPSDLPFAANRQVFCTLSFDVRPYHHMFGMDSGVVTQKCVVLYGSGNSAAIHIVVDDHTPELWKDLLRAQKGTEYITGRIGWKGVTAQNVTANLTVDPVKFLKMNAVTNDGIVKYARTAVELAIGLIGIMALWLGIMKIAEQSGLVAHLGRGLRPVMTRLFPDVPADHPAMGAMIMNISANMLGLTNAATPFGLKAMEELNKLNSKVGTATDAMCTFLVINTSSVQLIPATVIAIRAAAGSSNPTEILGPVIVATIVNTIVGVVTVKFLAKLPLFRFQGPNAAASRAGSGGIG